MNEFENILTDRIRLYFPNAEVISDLMCDTKTSFQNADYFFNNKQIVGELKCLEDEMHPKVQTYINQAMEEGKVSPSYGKIRIDNVLRINPNKEQINREINELVITSLEDCVEKANRQIRETKSYFALANSRGFVFIINRSNLVLDPKNALWNLHKMLNKRKNDGSIRYESINYIIYTSDNHYYQEGKMSYLPFFKLINDKIVGCCEKDEAFLDQFGAFFARMKGIRYIEAPNLKASDVMNLSFKTRNNESF